MKINGMNSIGAVNKYSKSQESQNAAGSGKLGKKKDYIEISDEAKELLNTQYSASSDKIAELKKSVASGTYDVNARLLADKLYPYVKK
ncbi:flagellar biosynthesis anti-sigma factor FlgM [Paenibacillus sp. y28]|uniref:flagellar biosynthesis anti-sigma factor FlgM n=1 Tax=Paenibacillus sp. y28 TaxID=3129110 RepID=UPI00301AC288